MTRNPEREGADLCALCGEPLGNHGLESSCAMFLSSRPSPAEAERAAIVAWLRSELEETQAAFELFSDAPTAEEHSFFKGQEVAYGLAIEAIEKREYLK